jgi:hypothetical protein
MTVMPAMAGGLRGSRWRVRAGETEEMSFSQTPNKVLPMGNSRRSRVIANIVDEVDAVVNRKVSEYHAQTCFYEQPANGRRMFLAAEQSRGY